MPPTLGVRLAPAVTFAISLALYLRTLLPGMAFDDWGELQTVPHVLGISHPTGYPTYILTAWLFELLPIGSVAFRANLLAAVCVAVALAAMTSTTLRLGVRPAIAVAAAVATGAIGTIWASAVVAEVNGLHLAFIALIVDRSLAWADERRTRDLALGGLLIGLSLGNHLLTAFVAPFFVLFALWEGRSTLLERKRLILAPVLAGLAGLAVYLYIPIAASLSPPLAYNHPTTFEAFRFLVTGEQFRGQYEGLFTLESLGVLANGLPELWSTALSVATAVVPILGLAGLAILVIRRPAFGLACAGTFLVGVYVWANYLRLPHYLLVPFLLLGHRRRGGARRSRTRGRSAPAWSSRPGRGSRGGGHRGGAGGDAGHAQPADGGPQPGHVGAYLRGRHVRGAPGACRDPLVLGPIVAAAARTAGARRAARPAHRGRHEHRLRRLGHA